MDFHLSEDRQGAKCWPGLRSKPSAAKNLARQLPKSRVEEQEVHNLAKAKIGRALDSSDIRVSGICALAGPESSILTLNKNIRMSKPEEPESEC